MNRTFLRVPALWLVAVVVVVVVVFVVVVVAVAVVGDVVVGNVAALVGAGVSPASAAAGACAPGGWVNARAPGGLAGGCVRTRSTSRSTRMAAAAAAHRSQRCGPASCGTSDPTTAMLLENGAEGPHVRSCTVLWSLFHACIAWLASVVCVGGSQQVRGAGQQAAGLACVPLSLRKGTWVTSRVERKRHVETGAASIDV